jgi:hypothetical protein
VLRREHESSGLVFRGSLFGRTLAIDARTAGSTDEKQRLEANCK